MNRYILPGLTCAAMIFGASACMLPETSGYSAVKESLESNDIISLRYDSNGQEAYLFTWTDQDENLVNFNDANGNFRYDEKDVIETHYFVDQSSDPIIRLYYADEELEIFQIPDEYNSTLALIEDAGNLY